jgi:hypothetical protein
MAGVQADELPKWIQEKHAINIHNSAQTRGVFERIATKVTSKRFVAGLLVAVLCLGALYCLTKKQ